MADLTFQLPSRNRVVIHGSDRPKDEFRLEPVVTPELAYRALLSSESLRLGRA